jgi:hypothetical protein
MTAFMKMLCGMFGRRTVTAERYAAGLACAQVHPASVGFDTLFADIIPRRNNVGDLVNMTANLIGHDYSFKY